jgi:protoheme IX farnesyltransferase
MSQISLPPPVSADVISPSPGSPRRRMADYLALTKPRIISLLLFTSVAAMVAASRGRPSLATTLAVLAGGALAAGGANAVNCAIDGDLDRKMSRTRERPVPAGRIAPAAAASYGAVLITVAVAWLWLGATTLSALLALLGAAWYVGVYTLWLKRRTPQNIVIGGAAGCFPPLVGWAAATGGLDATAATLAAVVLLWTPPHFWALATMLRGDYNRAGVPMLPVVASPSRVARQMRWYAVGTVLVSLLPAIWDGLDWFYTTAAVLLGVRFLRLTWDYPQARPRAAARLFHYSLLYLFLLFLAVGLDGTLGSLP